MTLNRRKVGNSVVLHCVGEALVEHAADVARQFMDCPVEKTGTYSLDLAGLEKVDTSFFQILVSFMRTKGPLVSSLTIVPLPDGHPVLWTGQVLGLGLETLDKQRGGQASEL